MIGKLLLIRESGILPFHLNQDKFEIDDDLLSGFCVANYNIARELNDSIDTMMMKDKYKIIFREFENNLRKKFIIAAFCHKYHIDEAVKNKMEHIFNRFFKEYEFEAEHATIRDEKFIESVREQVNDNDLKVFVEDHLNFIKNTIEPIAWKDGNDIDSYAITSSSNTVLFADCKKAVLERHPEADSIEKIIEGYLTTWNIKNIPQGDLFTGMSLIAGLDLEDFVISNQKTYGLCINSCINLKQDVKNELLLYFFGKNTLMRQCLISIEETLRDNLC
ncbi:MAG: hypothetical protein GF364_15645 [Candidatus Lokiarchaeota archaeon]|nr:hypothetical protein [Candidatus Lokiarchaeota archaeon]